MKKFLVDASFARMLFVVLWACAALYAGELKADEERIVAKPGDEVSIPGDSNHYTIARITTISGGLSIPAASTSGAVAFQAQIAGPGIGSLNSQCIIRAAPSSSGTVATATGWVHAAIACRGRSAAVSNPSATPNAVFATLSNPKIDDFGCVSFQATISGTGFSNVSGYWGSCGAALPTPLLMVQAGMPAPGLASGTLSSMVDAVMPRHASEPTLIFTSNVSGAPVPLTTRLFGKAVPGLMQLLACPGCSGAIPGDASTAFGSLLQFSVGDSGAVALYGGTSGVNAPGSVVWRARTANLSSLELIARQGAPAPGMDGWTYTALDGSAGARPIITNQGALIHTARVTNSSAQVDYGMWLTPPGTSQPSLLLRGQNQAPGFSAGTTIGALYSPTGVRSVFGGDVLPGEPQKPLTFISNLLGGESTSSTSRVLWRLPLGSLNSAPQALARGGMPAPETEPGTTFNNSSLGINIIGNHLGEVALFNLLDAPNGLSRYAYYITRNGALRLVAEERQAIPGTGLMIVSLNIQPQMYMNDLGQLVFYAFVSPDGSPNNAQFALVAADEDGTLRIVATPGQIVHPTNGPDCQLAGLSYSQSVPLIDTGDFVFGAVTSGVPFSEAIFSTHIAPPAPPPQCRADFNGDGRATLDDLFAFLNLWFVHSSGSDFNGDGLVTNQDLFDFLSAWFGGCP